MTYHDRRRKKMAPRAEQRLRIATRLALRGEEAEYLESLWLWATRGVPQIDVYWKRSSTVDERSRVTGLIRVALFNGEVHHLVAPAAELLPGCLSF